VATTEVDVLVKARDEASSVLQGVGKSAQSAGSRLKSIGAGMASAGRKMTIGMTLPLLAVGKASFDAASDLQESQSKVSVVFGKSAGDIERWSKTSAQAMGLSQAAALESAGTFGNLFTAMGMGKAPSADMSKSLTQLAGDLASFNNADPEEVLVNLRAGLMGEAEPLRKFGVQLSAARIEQEAMAMGLKKTNGEFTAAQKAQAAYSIIMQDTTKAQGDFARTSDGAANQQRILKAELTNAAAAIGSKLIPIGIKLMDVVRGLMEWFSGLSPEVKTVLGYFAGAAAVLGPVLLVAGKMVTAFAAVKSAITAIGIASKLAFLTNPAFLAAAAIITIVVLIVKNWTTVKAFLLRIWNAIKGAALAAWNAIKAAAVAVWNALKAPVVAYFNFYRGVFRTIIGVAKGAWNAIKGFGVAAWNGIKGAWDGLKSFFSGIWSGIGDVVRNAVNGVIRILNGFSITIPDIPGLPGRGNTYGFNIPYLADGGIVTGPTLAVIGEAGPEAVVPLSRGRQYGIGTGERLNVTVNIDRRRWVTEADYQVTYGGV
jgi:hypothetical protein